MITAKKLRKLHTGEKLTKELKMLQELCGHDHIDWKTTGIGKCNNCEKPIGESNGNVS